MRLTSKFVRALAVQLLLQSSAASPIEHDSFPLLLDATLEELRAGLDAGTFSSVDLVNVYIARIHEVNGELRAVNEINPDALNIAAALDLERQTAPDLSRSTLHGIPVLIKDNIGTADKMNNTAGSYALVGSKLKEDSTVVAKLRKAGAIILGKTNLAQFAGLRGQNTSASWSAYGGLTLGTYLPDQDPDGSSSGSGVASSIGLAWASLGTETGGSIIDPAHANNLVGIKPTVGLTSRFGVVPISEHQDTVGPLARTVKDAAALLQAIVGPDKRDNYTLASPFLHGAPDYLAACKEDGLDGKRIGVPAGFADWFPLQGLEPAVDAFDGLLDILRDAGAEVIEDIELSGIKHILDHSESPIVAGADFLTSLPRYLAQLAVNPNNVTNLAEIKEYTLQDPREDAEHYDIQLWDNILGRGIYNNMPEFWDLYNRQLFYVGPLALTGAMLNYSLDAIVLPPPHLKYINAAIGTPAISVPAGRAPNDTPVTRNRAGNANAGGPNYPFGLAFGGTWWSEETLIEIAYAFEQKTLVRKKVKPLVLPKTELRDVVEGSGVDGGEL